LEVIELDYKIGRIIILFADYFEKVAAAVEQFANTMANAFGYTFQKCIEAYERLEDCLKEIKEANVENTGTPPKKYGMSPRRCPRRTFVHYNYIPTAPRNLPYMRRAY